MKNKTQRIVSADAEKAFGKNSTPFHDINTQTRNKRKGPRHNKSHI